jgi:CDP-glucose 4,6-dehydratase
VLDPVSGYLMLVQRLVSDGPAFSEAWNFGPDSASAVTVASLIRMLADRWGAGARWHDDDREQPYEAAYLTLDCSQAATHLGWRPQVDLDRALDLTVEWYRSHAHGKNMRALSLAQIDDVLGLRLGRGLVA